MPSTPSQHRPYVLIQFAPSSGCLGSVVSVVTDFCRNVVKDPDILFSFRIAAYELTENLLTYSVGGLASICIETERTPAGLDLVLTTENEAEPERIADAIERLASIERAEDPVQFFDQLVRHSLDAPQDSRLGFGRLRAEGKLELSHRVEHGSLMVRVRRLALRATAVAE